MKDTVASDHFRSFRGLQLSSIGLGTYLGASDDRTDLLYRQAIARALDLGCNVLDTAINYRCQRSERVIGQVLSELVRKGTVRRDDVVVATKGGYIPRNLEKEFLTLGIMTETDIVAGCHCMTPRYIQHQLDQSLKNLGLSCIDIYYLHNPETQLEEVTREEFHRRIRAAFEVLEENVAHGKIRFYGTATWDGYREDPASRGHLSLEALVRLAQEAGGDDHHFKVIQLPYNVALPEAFTRKNQGVNGQIMSALEAAERLGLYVMVSASVYQGQLAHHLPRRIGEVLTDLTSDAQRAIQFVRSTPGVGTALVGMKQVSHVDENLAVARRERLPPEQLMTLFTQ